MQSIVDCLEESLTIEKFAAHSTVPNPHYSRLLRVIGRLVVEFSANDAAKQCFADSGGTTTLPPLLRHIRDATHVETLDELCCLLKHRGRTCSPKCLL